MSPGGLALFALGASRPFGEAVAARLGVALAAHEERDFEDGEHKARSLESVRGRDVYALHSCYGQPGASPNDKLLRLAFFAGSLRDAGAARVTAVVPYLAYARKDQRSKPRDPVTTRYVARLLEGVGVDMVLTLDVHNVAAFENAYRCRAENLAAAPVLAARAAALAGDGPVAVVSPDAGGIKRAEHLRGLLEKRMGRPVAAAFVEKYRSEGVLTGENVVGEVAGRTAILVDDIVASGGTLARAAAACRREGATRVLALAAHGLFSGAAPATLAASAIERIVVTDSVVLPLAAPLADRVERVSVAPLFAAAIRCLHEDGSLGSIEV